LCKARGLIAHCTGDGIDKDGNLFLYKSELKFDGVVHKEKRTPIIKETWTVDSGIDEVKGESLYEKSRSMLSTNTAR
jgi:hypothetical protein